MRLSIVVMVFLLGLGNSFMRDSHSANLPVPTRTKLGNLDHELAAIVNNTEHPLASLSVLAIRNGNVVYHRQFGSRYIDPTDPAKNKPADAATLYRIASISKLVTTLGVLKLVEQGKLKLDTDVSDYLGYRLRNPHFPDQPITLRMLLTHTSSLRDEAGYYWEARLGVNLKDVLLPGGSQYGEGQMWAKNAAPGAYFQYANLPWGVVGTIMERASGERFDRLMARLIFAPMGLRGGFHPADFSAADLAHTATLYRKRIDTDGKEIWNPAGPWVPQVDDYSKEAPVPRANPDYVPGSNGTLFGPQGNARLSAADLGKLMLMLMNEGMLEGKRILKKETVATMLAMQWRHDGTGANGSNSFGSRQDFFNAWGLGNQQFQDRSGAGTGDRLVAGGGFKAVGHLGDAWGLTSAFVFDRRKKNGLIYLIGGPGFDPESNKGQYSALYRHEEQILTALYKRAILDEVK